jgi:hypothetical protein
MPEHLTPNMIKALEALADSDKPLGPTDLGRAADVRFSKGSYMGQSKTFGVGSAGAAIGRALERRGLATEEWYDYGGEPFRRGWKITEAGRQKLSEVRSTLDA